MTMTRLSKCLPLLSLLAISAVTFSASLLMHRNDVLSLRFSDPDDALRLVQVRDFLAGQSWFDVSQHRVNPPLGGPMHWSRLVDLPIAGAILLLRPFLGSHGAEIGAILIVPAVTLLALLASLYWAVKPLMGQGRALVCCAAFAISPFIFVQCAAMRIDHHAWQAVMMALAMGGTLHPDERKGGLVAGIAMALWLEISIEGLALAGLTGLIIALRYAARAGEWTRLQYYSWALGGASGFLMLVFHGWKASLLPYCDSMSPIYFVPLIAMPPCLMISHRLFGQDGCSARCLSVFLTGCLAIVIFFTTGTRCLAGPFGTLDPLVHELWYSAIKEGLPLWVQSAETAFIVILPVLIGILAYLAILHGEANARRRLDWLSLLLFAGGGAMLAMLVLRTAFVAHLLSIPGTACLAAGLFMRARTLGKAILRIPATLMSLALLFPVLVLPIESAAIPKAALDKSSVEENLGVIDVKEFEALGRLAPAVLFAPLDIGPDILLRSTNAVIGTGYHRNVEGMKTVILAFVSAPDQAGPIVTATSATYLLLVPTPEVFRYQRAQPNGLAAQLLKRRVPPWLSPVPLAGLKYLRLYRIIRH